MSERKRDYSTADKNGMAFICNKWVYVGDRGYRVVFDGDGRNPLGDWVVLSYAGAHTSFVYGGRHTTEDEAHEYAARLAKTTPHPKPTEV